MIIDLIEILMLERRILWKCGCGWEKLTTLRGLKIHQGIARGCRKGQQQPCIAASGQTRGTQSQVENHSADRPIVAECRQMAEEEGPTVESNHLSEHQGDTSITSPRRELSQRVERKEAGRRNDQVAKG